MVKCRDENIHYRFPIYVFVFLSSILRHYSNRNKNHTINDVRLVISAILYLRTNFWFEEKFFTVNCDLVKFKSPLYFYKYGKNFLISLFERQFTFTV